MAEGDSFLNEVTEEVRRDQMVRVLRKNAVWIGLGLTVLIGGTVINEYMKYSARVSAEAQGDAMIAALTDEDAAAGIASLTDSLEGSSQSEVLVRLQLAALQAQEGELEAAVETLDGVASSPDAPPLYVDLARLKIATISSGIRPANDRLAILSQLTVEGHPFRAVALEQTAMVHLEEDDTAAALEVLGQSFRAPGLSADGQRRIGAMIVALGGEIPASTGDRGELDG